VNHLFSMRGGWGIPYLESKSVWVELTNGTGDPFTLG
jgi:hypothetical protein